MFRRSLDTRALLIHDEEMVSVQKHGFRVLVVDDNSDIRFLLHTVLKDAGYEVAQAEDGMEALRRMARGEFDLVVVDLKMPGMDGRELLRRIHVEYPDVKTMVLTGYDGLDGEREAIQLGVESYVRKPLGNIDKLLREAERILGARGLRCRTGRD